MSKRKPQNYPGPAVLDADVIDLSQVSEGDDLAIKNEWIPAFVDPAVDIWDAIAALPPGAWENVAVYLYRLEPAVSNKQSDAKYIGVYGTAIDQEAVKAAHGGGKFQVYVKYGKITLRRKIFSIDGAPIFQEGQTARGGQHAGQPLVPGAVSGDDQIAKVVRMVIDATGGNSKAADAGIDVMKKAMLDGMDLNKTIVTQQLNSATGSTLGDKLVDLMLPRLTAAPVAPTMDPIIAKFLDAAIANMKTDRREQNPQPAPPVTDQLALVKELLGVESLREVIDMGRGGKETPWWVGMISNAIEKLPMLLSEYSAMQERGFQRAIIAHQLGAGQQSPPTVLPPTAAPMIPAGAAAHAPQSAEAMSQAMIAGIVDGICKVFDEGYPGEMAAIHIKILYPELVEQLRPLLGNVDQLTNFVKSMPRLAERSQDGEWAEFQQEFIQEVMQTNEAPPPPGPVPVAPIAAAPRKASPKKTPAGLN